MLRMLSRLSGFLVVFFLVLLVVVGTGCWTPWKGAGHH